MMTGQVIVTILLLIIVPAFITGTAHIISFVIATICKIIDFVKYIIHEIIIWYVLWRG